MNEVRYSLNIQAIKSLIPHRAPFLLIDRILEIQVPEIAKSTDATLHVGTKVIALKNITYNEPYFQGHFPDQPIVPGVLLIEMIAQAAGFAVYPYFKAQGDTQNFSFFLVGVDEARFRRPVVPGDTLRIVCEVIRARGNKLVSVKGSIQVEGYEVAEAKILVNFSQSSQ